MGRGYAPASSSQHGRLPFGTCSTPNVPGSRQGLSHCFSEPQCPHPHNGAPLPRAFLLPGVVVQINEITLGMSHPQPRAGSSGCGGMCRGGLGGHNASRLPAILALTAVQMAERRQPLMERNLNSQPASRATVTAAGAGSRTPASSLPSPSPGAGPEGLLAGVHPSLAVASKVQTGPGTCCSLHTRPPLPGPTTVPGPGGRCESDCSCPLPALSSTFSLQGPGELRPWSDSAADSPGLIGELGEGGAPSLINPFHLTPLFKENQESRPAPPSGFRIYSKADFQVSGSSPTSHHRPPE